MLKVTAVPSRPAEDTFMKSRLDMFFIESLLDLNWLGVTISVVPEEFGQGE